MKLIHDSPDGMCIMAGCQYQAEKLASWITSKGPVLAPLCQDHLRVAWEKTVPGASRDSFTLWPLSAFGEAARDAAG